MTDLEAQTGSDALLRAYSPNERLAAQNIHRCAQLTDQSITTEDVLKELDQLVCSYNSDDAIDNRVLMQLQTLDAVFHYSVTEACKSNSGYFKNAFAAQKLFQETAKLLKRKSLPVPD